MSVSVIIPAYNRAHCIGGAVQSVLEQSQPADEIIVVDDASTDDLTAALEPFGDFVRVVRHTTNQGAAAARNTGVREARGTIIAFLDSDDAWFPQKQLRQLAFMEAEGLQASCTNFVLQPPGQPAWRPYAQVIGEAEIAWGCYTSPGSTFIVKRQLMLDIGGYDASFKRYEDWDILLRLVAQVPSGIGFLNEPLATIFKGSSFDAAYARCGLAQMFDRHGARLSDAGLGRRFRAGLAFNRAAVELAAGRRLSMVRHLALCWLLSPRGNWPLRVIAAPCFFGSVR